MSNCPRKDCYNNYMILIGDSDYLFPLAQARLQQGLRLCVICTGDERVETWALNNDSHNDNSHNTISLIRNTNMLGLACQKMAALVELYSSYCMVGPRNPGYSKIVETVCHGCRSYLFLRPFSPVSSFWSPVFRTVGAQETVQADHFIRAWDPPPSECSHPNSKLWRAFAAHRPRHWLSLGELGRKIVQKLKVNQNGRQNGPRINFHK